MNRIYILIITVLPILSFGKGEYKYGKVTVEELSQKKYPKDSLTGAVILYNIGKIEEGLFTRREKIKIYDKNALNIANQTIVLYSPKFSGNGITLYSIKGKTYNMENEKIIENDLSKKDVRIDKLDDYHDIVHFAFTNVKEGSIIEYEIQLNNVGIPNWYFQQNYPVDYSEFTTNMPDFYKFRLETKGYLSIPYAEESDRTVVYRSPYNGNTYDYNINIKTWKMKDIPAFVSEPYIYCQDNYISQINHELLSFGFPAHTQYNFTTSWTEIIKRLLDDQHHGQLLSSSSGFLKTEYDLAIDIKDNLQRLNACYKTIQNKMSWDGTNSIFSENIKNAYKETKGSVSDINFLLLRLLKDCNIESYPVILSTRNNGFMPMFPSFGKFNYMVVLAKVNGKSYLLDATDKYLPLNILPKRCLNNKGLIIKEGTLVEWVDLNSKYNSSIITSVDAKLSEEGVLKGKTTFKKSNYAAIDARHSIANNSSDTKTSAILTAAANGVEISNYTISNIDSIGLPIIEIFDFTINNAGIKEATTLLLEPIIFEQIKENPYKSPERTYPVELDVPIDIMYVVNITLPINYTIEEKPKSISLSMPDNSAKFSYQINVVNNTIQLIAKLSIKNTIYSQDQYPDLKEFYSQYIAKLNEPVLLQKK